MSHTSDYYTCAQFQEIQKRAHSDSTAQFIAWQDQMTRAQCAALAPRLLGCLLSHRPGEAQWLACHAKQRSGAEGQAGTVCVGYRWPFHANVSMCFDFQVRRSGQGEAAQHESSLLDYVTLPFYIAWLHRQRLVDEHYTRLHFDVLEGLTPAEVQVLRGLWRVGSVSLEDMAVDFTVKPSTLRKHIENIMVKKRESFQLSPDMRAGRINRVQCLMQHYAFLQWT